MNRYILLLLTNYIFMSYAFSQGPIAVKGPATITRYPLFTCSQTVDNFRAAAIGEATSQSGINIRIPIVETAYENGEGPLSYDLYNECDGFTPSDSSSLDISLVPIIDIDLDGEIISGYIVADNYFEVYVNGKLVSVDSTPYTPFNSSVFRFKAKRPYSLSVLVIDWDEHLGLGMELFPQGPNSDRSDNGNAWYTGDAGLLLRLSDGTTTDSSWKAQSFSIGPLDQPSEVTEVNGIHSTAHRGRSNGVSVKPECATQAAQPQGDSRLYPNLASLPSNCYALHYPVPDGWRNMAFDDASWPLAEVYSNEEVGTRNLPAFNRFTDLFLGAKWIWTSNLVLDNLVIARKTVD